uniref:Non-specific lipid-transfer protein n=1 Tax=Cajanus cajan TaxID=3821 RepID=A0A151RQA8_CAJCA|nr:Non-specific lipid-transfer protein [Cajanus cajan]
MHVKVPAPSSSPLLVKLTCVAVAVFLVSFGHIIPLAEADIPCGEVQFTVAPCIRYLRSPNERVPGICCNGARSINNRAKTTSDRRGVCRCVKSNVLNLPGLNLAKLAALPGACGINLRYKITPTVDCNTCYNNDNKIYT